MYTPATRAPVGRSPVAALAFSPNLTYRVAAPTPAQVARGSVRAGTRVRQLLRDPRAPVHHLHDLNHRAAAAAAAAAAATETPQTLAVARWYCSHLDDHLPVVVISDELAMVTCSEGGTDSPNAFALELEGVRVMSAAAYFSTAWSHVAAVQQLYTSLAEKEMQKEAEQAASAGLPSKRSAFR